MYYFCTILNRIKLCVARLYGEIICHISLSLPENKIHSILFADDGSLRTSSCLIENITNKWFAGNFTSMRIIAAVEKSGLQVDCILKEEYSNSIQQIWHPEQKIVKRPHFLLSQSKFDTVLFSCGIICRKNDVLVLSQFGSMYSFGPLFFLSEKNIIFFFWFWFWFLFLWRNGATTQQQ